MAASLVQTAEGTSTSATTTASFAGATTSGNLIVLRFASDDYNGTPDSGWTQSAEMEQQTFHGGYLWWRISTGETNFQYTIGSATNSAWVLEEWSGLEASPYDISEGQFQQTSTNNYSTPNITPTSGERLLLAMLGGSRNLNLSGVTWASWTNSFTAGDTIGSGGSGTNDLIGAAYRVVTADGSTAYSTGANTSPDTTMQSKSGLIIAFKIASAAAPELEAEAGAYTVTGTAANLLRGRLVSAEAGSYTINGTAANLFRGRAIDGDAGSYTVSGADANFLFERLIAAEGGSYSVSGQDATLTHDGAGAIDLIAEGGSYIVSGQTALFARTYLLDAEGGTYSINGGDVSLERVRDIEAESGTYQISGTDAAFTRTYILPAQVGSYTMGGNDANLFLNDEGEHGGKRAIQRPISRVKGRLASHGKVVR